MVRYPSPRCSSAEVRIRCYWQLLVADAATLDRYQLTGEELESTQVREFCFYESVCLLNTVLSPSAVRGSPIHLRHSCTITLC